MGYQLQLIAQFVGFSSTLLPHITEEELTVLVGCVDNAEARKTIAGSVEQQQDRTHPSRTWWIDAGNEADYGQVLVGNTADEQALAGTFTQHPCLTLPSPALLAPALLEPEPLEQAQSGHDGQTARAFACGAIRDEEVRRPTAINFHLAGIVIGYVDQLLHAGVRTFATYTSLSSMETHSARISALALARALGHTDAEAFARVLCPVEETPKRGACAKQQA